MFPDAYITERRLRVVRALPWVLPWSVVLELRDEDLDALDTAGDAYWRTLSRIVTRIQTGQEAA
jgi:hypothetical protein